MVSAETENAGGVHATGSAPGADSGALEHRIDELMKDAEKSIVPFEQASPAGAEIVSGDVPGPAVDEPFDLAKLSVELEGALRQAEAMARQEREAEKDVLDISPDSMVAVAVHATTEANPVGPDGEPVPIIDLEALDNALAQAADAVGFGIGGVELEPPRTERVEHLAHQIDIPTDPIKDFAPVMPQAPEPAQVPMAAQSAPPPIEQHAADPEAAAPIAGADPIVEAAAESTPQVEVHESPAPAEPGVVEMAMPEMDPAPAPEPAPAHAVKVRTDQLPEKTPDEGKNPVLGIFDAALRAIASPLTVMSPAVRDLVGWLGLLTAFNAACVWVFVMVVGPGNWPTSGAHGASPDSHEEQSESGHGAPKSGAKDAHGAAKDSHAAPAKKDAGHGAPPKKESGHGAPAKKDSGHGAAKKSTAHAPPKEKKKAGGGHH